MNKKTAAKTAKKAAPKKGGKPAKKAAPKVVTGHKAGTLPGDETKNGVLRPREGTQARTLWDICDKLKAKLGRPPARFEFRQAIFGKEYNPDSSSFQYFAWRKFHGVKGRSIGIYPKRNTFEANTPVAVKPKAKKAAKASVKPAAKKAAKKAAKPAKPAVKPKAKPVAKKAAKPAATPATKPTSGEKADAKAKRAARDKARREAKKAEAPKVSSRAAKAAEAAKASEVAAS